MAMKKPEQLGLEVDTSQRPPPHRELTTYDYTEMEAGTGVGDGKVTEQCLVCNKLGVVALNPVFPRVIHATTLSLNLKNKPVAAILSSCDLTLEQANIYRKARAPGGIL